MRWRQARNPPPPVLRAVLANVVLATLGGLLLLLYDWLAAHGVLPGGEARGLAAALYVAVVVVCGSLLTYLWVELPSGSTGVRRRSPWAAVLGLFASVPVVYLGLVIIFQVLRPLLP
ncbi:hypothetical protein BH23CHL8_BH23CHL8_19870 [soil metagenome]